MMDVNQTYCGHHFPINVNQTIMLYVLNLHSGYVRYFSISLEGKILQRINILLLDGRGIMYIFL